MANACIFDFVSPITVFPIFELNNGVLSYFVNTFFLVNRINKKGYKSLDIVWCASYLGYNTKTLIMMTGLEQNYRLKGWFFSFPIVNIENKRLKQFRCFFAESI